MHILKAKPQAEALLDRATALLESGHVGAARSILSAAQLLSPVSARHAQLSARLAMREQRYDDARQQLDAAIAAEPEHAGLRKLRAEVRRLCDDAPGAALDAAEAVILDPNDAVAKALLGVIMLALQETAKAVACLREAVAMEPCNASFRDALAVSLEAADEHEAALAERLVGISVAPHDPGPRNAAMLQCVRQRDFVTAVKLAEEARQAGVMDACLLGLKGHALSSLGRHDEAAEAYVEALKLGPEDPYVRHLAATAGAIPSGDRAPVEYLRVLFDGYADRFEAHLISLGYRVPGLIRAVVQACGASGPVLDLGCGTGLMGVVLEGLALTPIVGVDISPQMLVRAGAKQLYAELHESDVTTFLHDDERKWPLILAADVLCYFGSLDELFAAVRARMAPNGRFIFSCELLAADQQGASCGNGRWCLGRLGRYAHAEAYVLAAAEDAGLVVSRVEREIQRLEAGAPVAGLIVDCAAQPR